MTAPAPPRPARDAVTAKVSARVVSFLPVVAVLLLALGSAAGTHPQPALGLALGAASTLVMLGLLGVLASVAAVLLLQLVRGPRPALATPRAPARQHHPDTDGRPRPRAPGAASLPRAA